MNDGRNNPYYIIYNIADGIAGIKNVYKSQDSHDTKVDIKIVINMTKNLFIEGFYIDVVWAFLIGISNDSDNPKIYIMNEGIGNRIQNNV